MSGRRRAVVPEKQIEASILRWLDLKGVLAVKIENGGVFDQKRGAFRFNSGTRTKGIADILGIFKGLPLAIEVKSEKGRLSKWQEIFLQNWKKHGGVAIVARSIEDVERALGEIA